jgi:hypothetical protein
MISGKDIPPSSIGVSIVKGSCTNGGCCYRYYPRPFNCNMHMVCPLAGNDLHYVYQPPIELLLKELKKQ